TKAILDGGPPMARGRTAASLESPPPRNRAHTASPHGPTIQRRRKARDQIEEGQEYRPPHFLRCACTGRLVSDTVCVESFSSPSQSIPDEAPEAGFGLAGRRLDPRDRWRPEADGGAARLQSRLMSPGTARCA